MILKALGRRWKNRHARSAVTEPADTLGRPDRPVRWDAAVAAPRPSNCTRVATRRARCTPASVNNHFVAPQR